MSNSLALKSLTDKQKAFIVKYLALRHDYVKVKQDFDSFFKADIAGELILEIENKYPLLIEEQAKAELNNIFAEPMSHARVRLALIHEGIQDARKERIISTKQISEDEWVVEKGKNLPMMAKFIDQARAEEYMAKKLLLEVKKLRLGEDKRELTDTSFYNVEINTGFEEEE